MKAYALIFLSLLMLALPSRTQDRLEELKATVASLKKHGCLEYPSATNQKSTSQHGLRGTGVRPDSAHFFRAANANTFLLIERKFYDYDNEDRLALDSNMETETSGWEMGYKNVFDFNTANQPEKKRYFFNIDGVLELILRKEYVYDANDNLTMQTDMNFSWLGDSAGHRYFYAYNASNKVVEEYDQTMDINTTVYVNGGKTLHEYDGSQNEIEWTYQNWNGTAWVDQYRQLITRSSSANVTETINQRHESGTWKNTSRATGTYDANDSLTFWRQYRWNDTSSLWVESEREEFTYDSNGKYSMYYSYPAVNGPTLNDRKETFTWDNHSNLTSFIVQYWDSTGWVNSAKEEFAFSSTNNLASYASFLFSSSWDLVYIYEYGYNEDDSLLYEARKHLNGGGNAFSYDSIYYFYPGDSTLSVAKTEIENADFELNVYPNPSDGNVQVEIGDHAAYPITIDVYDIRGQLMLSKHVETAADLSMLVPSRGVNILHVHDANGATATRRLVVQ